MKNILIAKYLNWSTFGSASFDNNLGTNPNLEKFGIERNESGHFYISNDLVSFSDLTNGKVYRIRKNWESKDWNCYNLLYQKGIETGKFRMDIPILKEDADVLNQVWEYGEFQSPGQDYGKNYSHDVFQWPELTNGLTANSNITEEFKDSVKNYYKEFVDQSTEILSAAKSIAIQEMCGLPLGLAYIFNRYKDDQGYFWSDFDQFTWTRTSTDVLNDANLYLFRTLEFARYCGVLDKARALEVYEYGNLKWSTV